MKMVGEKVHKIVYSPVYFLVLRKCDVMILLAFSSITLIDIGSLDDVPPNIITLNSWGVRIL